MHKSIELMLENFTYDHLPMELAVVSAPICKLSVAMAESLGDDPEVTVGLRKLLEAKDCFVRAAVRKAKLEKNKQQSRECSKCSKEITFNGMLEIFEKGWSFCNFGRGVLCEECSPPSEKVEK